MEINMSDEIFSPEELEKWIRSAKEDARVWKERNKIRIDVDGTTKKIPFDEELFTRLRAVASEVRQKLKSQEEAQTTRGRPPVVTTDVGLFQIQVKGKRPLVEQLMEHLAWTEGAFLDIGKEATLATLIASGEDPSKIPQIIQQFNKKEDFVNYVMSKYYNFIEASTRCGDVSTYKEQVLERDIKIALLQEQISSLESQLNMLQDNLNRTRKMLEVALALMDDRQRDVFNRMLYVIIGMAEQPVQMAPEVGGEEIE
jgi:hypothetical protein